MSYIDVVAEAVEHELPEATRPAHAAETLYRLYALLVLTRGTETTLEDVHDAWSVWMAEQGEDHESLVPFADLDRDTQLEDRVYMEAIHSVARNLSLESR
jgi:hypothetical protein